MYDSAHSLGTNASAGRRRRRLCLFAQDMPVVRSNPENPTRSQEKCNEKQIHERQIKIKHTDKRHRNEKHGNAECRRETGIQPRCILEIGIDARYRYNMRRQARCMDPKQKSPTSIRQAAMRAKPKTRRLIGQSACRRRLDIWIGDQPNH